MKQNPATILFFGRPGAGKSTQAERITEYLKARSNQKTVSFLWSHIRDEFMRGNSSVQERLQENHRQGRLQPKFFSISVWGPVLLREIAGDENLIIDGVPRQAFEAEALDSAFDFLDRTPILVFNMILPKERAAERMRARAVSEGRVDDSNEESINRRLAWFETDTEPILESLRSNPRYIVVDINADDSREAVEQALRDSIDTTFASITTTRRAESQAEEPAIVVSVGAPGAGKTTLLKPLAGRLGLVYVSRDAIRQEFFGNPILQKDKDLVWNKANKRAREALSNGVNVVYDATFAEPTKRKEFIRSLREMGWKRVIGFYVDTPPDISKVRNQNREHAVPDDVLEEHFFTPLREHPPALEDGFDELYRLKDIESLEHALTAK